jgi:hypothetical protein
MRALTVATTAIVALSGAAPASADPGAAGANAVSYPPPFVDHVVWTQWNQQFLCHWELAEVLQPGKTSWNLEPWRPVVDDTTMVGSGCNPGGSEERF